MVKLSVKVGRLVGNPYLCLVIYELKKEDYP
jgi:hypothetical protein